MNVTLYDIDYLLIDSFHLVDALACTAAAYVVLTPFVMPATRPGHGPNLLLGKLGSKPSVRSRM
jgi:hypothetical protein